MLAKPMPARTTRRSPAKKKEQPCKSLCICIPSWACIYYFLLICSICSPCHSAGEIGWPGFCHFWGSEAVDFVLLLLPLHEALYYFSIKDIEFVFLPALDSSR